MTGLSDSQSVIDSLRAFAADFLIKPLEYALFSGASGARSSAAPQFATGSNFACVMWNYNAR